MKAPLALALAVGALTACALGPETDRSANEPTATSSAIDSAPWFVRGTFNDWGIQPMETVGRSKVALVDVGPGLQEVKFDRWGDWSDNYGDNDRDFVGDSFGANIELADGPGRYRIAFDPDEKLYQVTQVATAPGGDSGDEGNGEQQTGDWQRTVIMVRAATRPGETVFFRGGLDYGYATRQLGRDCEQRPDQCAIPIRHLNRRNPDTAALATGDAHLDWQGAEPGQPSNAAGSPASWTIDRWPHAWGPAARYGRDGFGETSLNRFGRNYWLLDVQMRCDETADGWFEVRAFVAGGRGWEPEIAQPGAPYRSDNHFGRCGRVNVFDFGGNEPIAVDDLPRWDVEVTNPAGFPSNERVVLHRIHDLLEPRWQTIRTPDVARVRLTNHSASPVALRGARVRADSDGYFEIAPDFAASLPRLLDPGAEIDVPVTMVAGIGPLQRAPRSAQLELDTDAARQSQVFVRLAGYNMAFPEGGNEPTVWDVWRTFGIDTWLTYWGQRLDNGGAVEAVGQEVLSETWERVDPTRPVEVLQLSAFHSCCWQSARLEWRAADGFVAEVVRHGFDDGQALLPGRADGFATSAGEFSPDGPFSILIDGVSSVAADNGGLHLVRFFPLILDEGAPEPGAWLAIMDYPNNDGTPGNLDYNDNTYVLRNVAPAAPGPRPSIRGASIARGAANVSPEAGISARPRLVAGGLDNATVTRTSVKLVDIDTGVEVVANVNSTGGGDAITLQPVTPLRSFTRYRFAVTSDVRDVAGQAMTPFALDFTTGPTTASDDDGTIAFDRTVAAASDGFPVTSVAVGPDRAVYAGTLFGALLRFGIGADGELETPTTVFDAAAGGAPRTITGLRFDVRDQEPVLWVVHGGAGFPGAADWTGAITRLSGSGFANAVDVVVGLPHSVRDHMTNGLEVGPDGALYVLQGSNTALGAPDTAWGFRPERLLTAALLRIDVDAIAAPPLDVRTEDGGSYDPYAAGAPVTLHATGLRNAYDLVFTESGRLYVTVNGSAPGGNVPAEPAVAPPQCANRPDGDWISSAAPAIRDVQANQPDELALIEPGAYYGHPNPARCEWILLGGNPTAAPDPDEVEYPVGVSPDPRFAGFVHEFGHNKSANGIIEYRGPAFDGALDGRLLVARYSQNDDIVVLDVAADGSVTRETVGLPGLTGFANPLDLAQDPETGAIYVAELTAPERGRGRLSVLRPVDEPPAEP